MIISSRHVDDEKIIFLINDIKRKKTLKGVKRGFVAGEIAKYLYNHPKALDKLISSKKYSELIRSGQYKKIIKDIRNLLHKTTGAYQTGEIDERNEFLRELESSFVLNVTKGGIIKIHEKLLSTNTSTRERIDIYPSLYKKIFRVAGKPKSILDLGSGINPLSYIFMNIDKLQYFAYEINNKDVIFLQRYFDLMKEHSGLRGEAKAVNLLRINEDDLPEADICFMFKLIEVLEQSKKHKISEELIKKIKSRFIVVSFATETLSRRKMNHAKRGWFEMMLRRLEYDFDIIEEENEIFYIIKKQDVS